MRATKRGMTKRTLLAMLATGMGASTASAQQGFDWLNLPGFGSQNSNAQDKRAATDARAREKEAQTPLNDLRPGSIPFRSDKMLGALDAAIGQYTQIAQRGGWPRISSNRLIRPGDDDDRVPAVRRRLMMTGELKATNGLNSFNFDGELEAAVRRFQESHGLRISGRADGPTIQAMNVPVQARINQLKLNFQRLEDLIGQRIEDRYILVNVPGFQLEAVYQSVVELRHRVIAGKPERQTPQVRAQIKALNFFPFWRVPDSVAVLDLIPRLQKEPEYLEKEQIRVLTGNFNGPEIDRTAIDWRSVDPKGIRFRQDPGPQNALGLVRLDMPNEHGVYMHDTPMKPLFGQRARAFSAGCVRVQDVFALAAWIAREEAGIDRAKIDEILASGNAVDIALRQPIPVYFTYITAWAEPNGRLEFRPDIYGRDGLSELAGDRERDPDAPPPRQALAP